MEIRARRDLQNRNRVRGNISPGTSLIDLM